MGLGKKLIIPQDTEISYAVDDSNLRVHLDANNPLSYSGSGTTWTDLKGNANATLVGGASFNSTGYMNIGSNSQSIEIAHTNYMRPGTYDDWSISFWARTTYSTANWGALINKGGPNDWEWQIWVMPSGDNRGVNCAVFWSGGNRVKQLRNLSSSNTWFSANTWHNITMVLDGNAEDSWLYVDGVERATDHTWDHNSTDTSTKKTLIGYRQDYPNNYRWQGDINNIRVYDKLLSTSEVSAIHTAGYQG